MFQIHGFALISKINLFDYTLKSKHCFGYYFIEWKIEGSNDEKTWKILDNRNAKELCGNSIVKTYECSETTLEEFFRLIRMIQAGKNSGGIDGFALSGIELFGILRE
jgi:hypothetical protein